MKLHIFSKPFFENYIIHPLSKDLTKGERAKALISSIAIGIFSLGICQAVCAIKFHNRRTQHIVTVDVHYANDLDKIAARKFLERVCPRDYLVKCEFIPAQFPAQIDKDKPSLFVYNAGLVSTELAVLPKPSAKLLILIKSNEWSAPPLLTSNWENQNIAYLDSAPTPEIKGFFIPTPEQEEE
ncbi:MAG: hypothetical protein ACK5MA_02810 [Parachlamydiaceae bacterium]